MHRRYDVWGWVEDPETTVKEWVPIPTVFQGIQAVAASGTILSQSLNLRPESPTSSENTKDMRINTAFGDASTAISRKTGKKKDPCTDFFTKGRSLEEVSAIFGNFWKSAVHAPSLPAAASTANSGQAMAATLRLGNAFFAVDDTTPGTDLSWSFANNMYLTNAHQLTSRQNRALTILHEFAHALDLIPHDNPTVDPSGRQSRANDATIYKNCGHILDLLPLRD